MAVPAYDPAAPVAVKEIGVLLRASVQRQRALATSLQRLVPKLGPCKRVSFAVRHNWPVFVQKSSSTRSAQGSLLAKVGADFGPGASELAAILAASAGVMRLVAAKGG